MKILVGVDGSNHSYEALKYAIGEAKLKNAELTAVLSLVEAKTREEAQQHQNTIKQARELMHGAGMEPDARFLVRAGTISPAEDIIQFAEENGYDQIIVGSHGRTGISRILLGSVAEEVVRKARCPVTVFRSQIVDPKHEHL